jgi:hypothetical protein
LTEVLEVLTAFIIRTIRASVSFYQKTRRSIPEDSHHHNQRCENLKSHHISGNSLLEKWTSQHIREDLEIFNESDKFQKL